MTDKKNPVASPRIVLREEFDDWAVLYDPDTGDSFGLNPVSVFIWKLLDGEHNNKDILKKLSEKCKNLPGEAESEIEEFVDELVEQGFAGSEMTLGEKKLVIEDKELTYERPALNPLGAPDSGVAEAPRGEPGDMAECDVGQSASYLCGLGFSPSMLCGEGAGDDG